MISRWTIRRPLVYEAVAVVCAYAALTILVFWPAFAHPGRTVITPRGRFLAADVNLFMWELAWGAHALVCDPLNLFNANTFHPAPASLTGSDHMLGHQLLFGPAYALTGNVVFASQMNILFAIALCGASMYALLRHWGVPWAGAFFGGFVYAYGPGRYYRVWMVQLIAGQYLPLALLFLDRTLREGRGRVAAAFAVALAMQVLCSFYMGYMALVVLLPYALAALLVGRSRLSVAGVPLLASAALAAGLVIVLVALPYLRSASHGTLVEHTDRGMLSWYSIHSWTTYLRPPNGAAGIGGLPSYYMGALALVLAVIALLPGRPVPGATVPWARLGLVAAIVASHVMALGPVLSVAGRELPTPYGLALHWAPGFAFMRMPSRFAFGVLFGVAGLAGLGFGRFLARVGGGRPWPSLAMLLIAIGVTTVDFGILRNRHEVIRLPETPAVYRALAAAEPGPVLEIPFGQHIFIESEYMRHSLVHWNRLLNGYTGHTPPTVPLIMSVAQALPSARATEVLVRLTGLRYVAVHRARLPPHERARWDNPAGLRRLGTYGDDVLFEVAERGSADLQDRLLNAAKLDETVLGTPLTPVPAGDRQGTVRLSGRVPTQAWAGLSLPLDVEVKNGSVRAWPALAPRSRRPVSLAYRWEQIGGGDPPTEGDALLPYDLQPDDAVRALIPVRVPRTEGEFRLTVGVAQYGDWFPSVLRVEPIRVERLKR